MSRPKVNQLPNVVPLEEAGMFDAHVTEGGRSNWLIRSTARQLGEAAIPAVIFGLLLSHNNPFTSPEAFVGNLEKDGILTLVSLAVSRVIRLGRARIGVWRSKRREAGALYEENVIDSTRDTRGLTEQD